MPAPGPPAAGVPPPAPRGVRWVAVAAGGIILLAAALMALVIATSHPGPASSSVSIPSVSFAPVPSLPAFGTPAPTPGPGGTIALQVPATLNGEQPDTSSQAQAQVQKLQTAVEGAPGVVQVVAGAYGPTPDQLYFLNSTWNAPIDPATGLDMGFNTSGGAPANQSDATPETVGTQTIYCWTIALNGSNAELCSWIDSNVQGLVLDLSSQDPAATAAIANRARQASQQTAA